MCDKKDYSLDPGVFGSVWGGLNTCHKIATFGQILLQ